MNPSEDSILELLSASAPFASLPPEALRRLAGLVRLERFKHDEVVFSEGQKASDAWMVLSGRARILVFYAGARQLQVELVGKGEIFGLFCRLGRPTGAYPCTATADGALAALRIRDSVFHEFYDKHPSVARQACVLCAARLGAMQKLVPFGQEAVSSRVAEILLDLFETHGSGIPATRAQIALKAGTALETVFRVLAAFRRKGWVRTGRARITLMNPAALRSYLEERRG